MPLRAHAEGSKDYDLIAILENAGLQNIARLGAPDGTPTVVAIFSYWFDQALVPALMAQVRARRFVSGHTRAGLIFQVDDDIARRDASHVGRADTRRSS
jgi:hypothetical protein